MPPTAPPVSDPPPAVLRVRARIRRARSVHGLVTLLALGALYLYLEHDDEILAAVGACEPAAARAPVVFGAIAPAVFYVSALGSDVFAIDANNYVGFVRTRAAAIALTVVLCVAHLVAYNTIGWLLPAQGACRVDDWPGAVAASRNYAIAAQLAAVMGIGLAVARLVVALDELPAAGAPAQMAAEQAAEKSAEKSAKKTE